MFVPASANTKRATSFNVALMCCYTFMFWLPDLDSNQGPAD